MTRRTFPPQKVDLREGPNQGKGEKASRDRGNHLKSGNKRKFPRAKRKRRGGT